MKTASSVLIAVATELSELAKRELPELRKGEEILREWYENGTNFRETKLNERTFIATFDFRQRKSRRMAVRGGNKND